MITGMLREMRKFVLSALVWLALVPALPAMPGPEDVAVLYNSADPESLKLAEIYRDARHIPQEHLIGLPMPARQDLTRDEYDQTIRNPLRGEFRKRGWVQLAKDSSGIVLPIKNKIRILVTMRGVPLRILPVSGKEQPNPQNPTAGHNEASVDSDLAMFGVEGLPMDGILKNQFFQSEKSITEQNFPFLILTARIDAPRYETCERMIRDAIETEKTGLWGRAYVDVANKVPQGDQWLLNVAKMNLAVGIPTVVDVFNDTFPKNYPATDMALYYGWYDWNVSGPFLNPAFRLKKGAVAMHLHSFSAEQLRDGNKNWSGALLERGAAATVGNVYEPYLHLTHYFDIIQKSLLAGHTWVEAAWMAMPVTSWQGVVLGDPLYCPYQHLDGSGEKTAADTEYRALRAAMLQWPTDSVKRRQEITQAAERMPSGTLAEAVGLEYLANGRSADAADSFRTAKRLYVSNADKLRQELNLIAMDRVADRKPRAVQALRDAKAKYGPIPESEALQGWLDILDPPPPPLADPTRNPSVKKP